MDFMTLLSASELPLSSVKISFIPAFPRRVGEGEREKKKVGERGKEERSRERQYLLALSQF